MQAVFRVGPVSLSEMGTFSAATVDEYETRVASVMRALVDPEPSTPKVREKRSRLLTQVKQAFRKERVLALRGEDIGAHRLVSSFVIDDGLTADLALRNGAMHVVETADATGDQDALRRAVSEIAVAALVLERARMKFGENETKTKLVYSASPEIEKVALPSLDAAAHQGTELVNWLSVDDRAKFINTLSSVAEPVPRKRQSRMLVARFANSNTDGAASRGRRSRRPALTRISDTAHSGTMQIGHARTFRDIDEPARGDAQLNITRTRVRRKPTPHRGTAA